MVAAAFQPADGPDESPLALALRGITHHFGSTLALDDASLVVRRGTLHAVLGENGAGKTTLMRCAFGLLRPDEGRMQLHGAPYSPRSPRDAHTAGIGMVHQHFTLVPAMTVAENIALGGTGVFSRSGSERDVRELSERTGLRLPPDARAGDLPVGAQQRVEILKSLARGARLLILDEPSAVLAPAEAMELHAWLRRYVAAGNTAVVVTHKLKEALAMADDVTVLRRGRTVLTAPPGELDENVLVRAMIGESRVAGELASELVEHRGEIRDGSRGGSPIVFSATDLRVLRENGSVAVDDASFTIRAGEIVGVVGVEGAGQRELLRALAGLTPPSSGTLRLPERIGFVPEDRHRDALVLDFMLHENVALADAGSARGVTPWRALRERTARLLSSHDIRAGDVRLPARALSGGNQQKLVLARELDGDAPALVLENPTRGLDVRAAAAVHADLRAAREAGVAVVFHASDLDEVLALADRVLVMYSSRVREVTPERERVGRAMVGA